LFEGHALIANPAPIKVYAIEDLKAGIDNQLATLSPVDPNLALVGTTLYAATQYMGGGNVITAWDVSDPQAPALLDEQPLSASDVAVGTYDDKVVVLSDSGLEVFIAGAAGGLSLQGPSSLESGHTAMAMYSNQRVVVGRSADGNASLGVLFLGYLPTLPVLYGGAAALQGTEVAQIVVEGDVAYVATDYGLERVDLGDAPTWRDGRSLDGGVSGVRIDGVHATLTSTHKAQNGVHIVDVSDPETMRYLGFTPVSSDVNLAGISAPYAPSPDWAFVSASDGVHALQLGCEEVCDGQGVDEDGDGLADCLDPDCAGDAALGCPCTQNSDCADDDPCTTHDCQEGVCVVTAADGQPCDDGDGCTVDACDQGVCQGVPITSPHCEASCLPSLTAGDLVDTGHTALDVAVDGDVAYASTNGGGIKVYDRTHGTWILAGSFSDTAIDLAVADGLLYAVTGGDGTNNAGDARLLVLDASQPEAPNLVSELSLLVDGVSVHPIGLEVEGGVAVVASSYGLHAIDVSVPSQPALVADGFSLEGQGIYPMSQATNDVPGALGVPGATKAYDIVRHPSKPGRYYVGTDNGLVEVDGGFGAGAASFEQVLMGSVAFDDGGMVLGVRVQGGLAYLSVRIDEELGKTASLRIVDVSTPGDWQVLSDHFLANVHIDPPLVADDIAYVPTGNGLFAVDVSDPAAPHTLQIYTTYGFGGEGRIYAVERDGAQLYVPGNAGVVRALDVGCCNALNDDCDGDGLGPEDDNCPETYNESQADADGDGQGDACDDNVFGCVTYAPIDIADMEGYCAETEGALTACVGDDGATAQAMCAQATEVAQQDPGAFSYWACRAGVAESGFCSGGLEAVCMGDNGCPLAPAPICAPLCERLVACADSFTAPIHPMMAASSTSVPLCMASCAGWVAADPWLESNFGCHYRAIAETCDVSAMLGCSGGEPCEGDLCVQWEVADVQTDALGGEV
ncbi:MAG: hypothetical protein QF464_06690, partial [Myxococcota bacterium]|nr:hypothetical protein [Myxococcota bacterium]